MGVTNRHLFLLEVNLIKQTKIQTLRCLSKKLSLSKPKRRNWSTSSKLPPQMLAKSDDDERRPRKPRKVKRRPRNPKKPRKVKRRPPRKPERPEKPENPRKPRKLERPENPERLPRNPKRPERPNDDPPRKPSRKPEKLDEAEKPLKKPARKPEKPDDLDDESPERAESKFLTTILLFQLGLSSVPNSVVRSLIESTILRQYKLVQI